MLKEKYLNKTEFIKKLKDQRKQLIVKKVLKKYGNIKAKKKTQNNIKSKEKTKKWSLQLNKQNYIYLWYKKLIN